MEFIFFTVSTSTDSLHQIQIGNKIIFRQPIPEREMQRIRGDLSAPYRTATLVGCAFAIDRQFYHEIGKFDPGQKIWGGDNIELSLRVWKFHNLFDLMLFCLLKIMISF